MDSCKSLVPEGSGAVEGELLDKEEVELRRIAEIFKACRVVLSEMEAVSSRYQAASEQSPDFKSNKL